MTTFAGRAVIVSTLDPVPPNFRVGPGQLVLSVREARALASGDAALQSELIAAINAYDRARLARVLQLDQAKQA